MVWHATQQMAFMPLMLWTADEVVSATGARSVIPGNARFDGVTTDSRNARAGSLFFALAGATHDGHDHVAEALQHGCEAAVVQRPPANVEPRNLLVVPDTLAALGDLAAWTRRQMPVRVVAITGSAGKSTTKELTAAICGLAHPRPGAVLKTQGNFNNLIGLPLTLLRASRDETVAVLEMGMNQRGEIARLTKIAQPNFAAITNIGLAHVEGVGGGIEGVARAKGELVEGLSPHATLAVNLDDPWVTKVCSEFRGRRVTYGGGGEVQAHRIRDFGFDGVAFDLEISGQVATVRLRLVGIHNVTNALAAAALGHAMGFRLEVIASGLERTVGMSMRMEVVRLKNGVTVINDTYNANPSSVEAALESLRRTAGRSVVVLGEMRELGAESRRAHYRIGERAASLGLQRLIFLGPSMQAAAEGARGAGLSSDQIILCDNHDQAAAAVTAVWRAGDTILVKGSHSMHMEEVVRLLESAGNAS